MNSMNILISTLAYWPYVGGHAVLTKTMAEGLAKRGYNTSVLTSNLTQFSPLTKTSTGLSVVNRIPVFRFDSAWPDASKSGPLGNAFTSLVDNLSSLDEKFSSLQDIFVVLRSLSFPFSPQTLLWGLTHTLQADIIHAVDLVWSTSFISFLIGKKKKIPYIITPLLHTYSHRHRGASLFKVMKEAKAVIASTQSEQEFIVKKGLAQTKVHHIGLGVDPKTLEGGCGSRFRSEHSVPLEDPIVLFIGRKEVDKGVIQLIKAMNFVWNVVPDARLVIIGPNGILPADVKAYQTTLSRVSEEKKKRILDLGVVTDSEKLDALSASDIFAMPSVRESFGLVYLEAWYYRKPVIGAACKPISDVIDDQKDGLLVRFGDERDLAESILNLLRHEQLREELGNTGYKKLMMNYTSEVMLSKLDEVYQGVHNK
jgi:glycosyltransferase involved in cell wall biosynthesis